MKYLILVRHSIAENGSFSITDFNRSLTNQGIQMSKIQAEKLLSSPFNPDIIVSSPAKRAMQTANVFLEILNVEILKEFDFLYKDYSTTEFIDFLSHLPNNCSQVLLVGHNPSISAMSYHLTSGSGLSFAPATMAVLKFNTDFWSEIEMGSGVLEKVYVQRI